MSHHQTAIHRTMKMTKLGFLCGTEYLLSLLNVLGSQYLV